MTGARSPLPTRSTTDDSSEWKVILRDEAGQQMVLYNESDRSVQVQNPKRRPRAKSLHALSHSLNSPSTISSLACCSQCGRPWPNFSEFATAENAAETANPQQSFPNYMDRNYFRLLDISSRQPRFLEYPKLNSKKPQNIEETSDYTVPKNLNEGSFNQGYYAKFFREDGKLGRGAGGSVFKCQHILDGIELGTYAVKKVAVGDDHTWLDRMLREVHILENLRHSNIIEYKHAWLEFHQLTTFGPSIPCLFILMQLAEGGNLEEFILGNSPIDIAVISDLFSQIAQGLAHLHRCGILHRDLKPSNILLQFKNGRWRALITDFGEGVQDSANRAPVVSNDVSYNANRTGATGTIEFVAPELLKIDRRTGNFLYQHSKGTDIWSLGLIFYFMLTGKLPYSNIDDIDVLKTSMTSLKQVVLPKEANKLPDGHFKALGAMLQVDPELRPNMEQVLRLMRSPLPTNAANSVSPLSSNLSVKIASLQKPPPLPLPPTNSPSILDENTKISLALLIVH